MNYQVFQAINSFAGRWAPIDGVVRFAAVEVLFVVFAVAGVICVRALLRREIRAVVCLALPVRFAEVVALIGTVTPATGAI